MRRAIVGLVVLLGLPACTHSRLVGGGPVTAPGDVPEGTLRYYVGKNLVVVTGTVKRTWEPYLEPALTEPKGDCIAFRETTSWVGQVGLQVVPDTTKAFWLQYIPGDSSDDKMTVNIRENGILGDMEVTSTSQGAEVLKNVATFAGILAGAVGAQVTRGAPFSTAGAEQRARGTETSPAQGPPRSILAVAPLLMALDAEYPSDAERAKAQATIRDLDRQMPPLWRAAFRDPDAERAVRLCVHGVYLDAVIATRQEERIALLRRIAAEPAADFAPLMARLVGLGTAIEILTTERTATSKAFASEMEAYLAFLRRSKCGQDDREDAVVQLLELADLPPQKALGAGPAGPTALETASVRKALLRWPRAATVFADAHVVLTLDEMDGGPRKATPAACAGDPRPAGTGAPAGRIFYRQSRPLVLRVWEQRKAIVGQASACAVDDSLVVTSQRVVDVLDPASAPEYLEFDPRAFAQSHLKLSKDESGRLTALVQDSTSSLQALSGGLATAATNLRDQYATTMSRAADTEDVKRRLRVADLVTDAEVRRKEKEKIDAEVALAGASASKDLLERQAVVTAQYNLANSKVTLEKVEASGAAQVQAEATTQELNRLRAEVDLLRQQIEFLKQQQALEALKKEK